MSFTYDVTTDLGKVRLLAIDAIQSDHLYEDEEIEAVLSINNNSIRLAAAQLLDTTAANEAYVQKRLKLLDVMTDGQVTADSIGKLAAELRRQEYEGSGDFSGQFDWAEMVYDAFSERERLIVQFERVDAPA